MRLLIPSFVTKTGLYGLQVSAEAILNAISSTTTHSPCQAMMEDLERAQSVALAIEEAFYGPGNVGS